MSERQPPRADEAQHLRPPTEPGIALPSGEATLVPVDGPTAAPAAAASAQSARDILLSPEPVLTSLLHGAKAGGFFALFMWGFDAVTDTPKEPEFFLLNAVLIGGIEVLRRQSGDHLGPAVMRVFGTSVAAMGAIIVTVETMQQGDHAVLPFGLLALVGGVALLLVGIRKQRRERHADQVPIAVLPPERRIPRQELEARFERQAEAVAPRERRRLWAMGGGVAAMLAATFLPDVFGVADRIPDAAYGVLLVAFFGGMIGTVWAGQRSAHRDAERFGTRCPQCEQPLRGATLNTRRMKLLELAGQCPHCRTQVTEATP